MFSLSFCHRFFQEFKNFCTFPVTGGGKKAENGQVEILPSSFGHDLFVMRRVTGICFRRLFRDGWPPNRPIFSGLSSRGCKLIPDQDQSSSWSFLTWRAAVPRSRGTPMRPQRWPPYLVASRQSYYRPARRRGTGPQVPFKSLMAAIDP